MTETEAQYKGSKLSKEVGQERGQNNHRAGGRAYITADPAGERQRDIELRKSNGGWEKDVKDDSLNLFSPCFLLIFPYTYIIHIFHCMIVKTNDFRQTSRQLEFSL